MSGGSGDSGEEGREVRRHYGRLETEMSGTSVLDNIYRRESCLLASKAGMVMGLVREE